jgi:hypothetical protein
MVEGRAEPVATVTAGVGNAFGWAGFQGERYLTDGRLSLFAGLGYVPASTEDDRLPTGVAWAVGVRAFTPSLKHRGFAEVSIVEVARSWRERVPGSVEQKHFYGPSVQVGYQRVSDGGFTFTLSAGVGFVLDSSFPDTVHLTTGLGFGYSWRSDREQ